MSRYYYEYTCVQGGAIQRKIVKRPTLISKVKNNISKRFNIKYSLPKLSIAKKSDKYYCEDRNRWCTEYVFLGLITLYKLTLNTKRDKWSFRKSKKRITKARKTTLL